MSETNATAGRYIDLTRRKRNIEAELREINGELAEVESTLIEQFVQDGLQSVAIKGLGTAYLRSDIWASAPKGEDGHGDYDAACDALERAGLAQFVQRRFNAQTVSAYVRNLPRDEATGAPVLPPELDGNLTVSIVPKIGVRESHSVSE